MAEIQNLLIQLSLFICLIHCTFNEHDKLCKFKACEVLRKENKLTEFHVSFRINYKFQGRPGFLGIQYTWAF